MWEIRDLKEKFPHAQLVEFACFDYYMHVELRVLLTVYVEGIPILWS